MTDQLNRQFLENFAALETLGVAQLVAAGRLLGAIQLAEKLGVTIESISEAARNNHLFFIEGADRELFYPAFYATEAIKKEDVGANAVQLRLNGIITFGVVNVAGDC